MWFFFFQAEDGIRDLVRSRGLGDVYKRQVPILPPDHGNAIDQELHILPAHSLHAHGNAQDIVCLLYTSDAADERSSVDLGGRRIIKKKTAQIINDGQLLTEKRLTKTHTESKRHHKTIVNI